MTTRRIDLEERLLFAERDLEELSRIVARQGLVIEQLEAEVRELRRTAAAPGSQEARSESDTARTLEDDRPPHY